MQNHFVPISVPFSVFEDDISRTEILQSRTEIIQCSSSWFFHPQPIIKSTIDGIWHNWGDKSLISVGGSPQDNLRLRLNLEESFEDLRNYFYQYFVELTILHLLNILGLLGSQELRAGCQSYRFYSDVLELFQIRLDLEESFYYYRWHMTRLRCWKFDFGRRNRSPRNK